MQLMPATGRELAKQAGVKYDPFDPEQNRMLGTMYLKQMLQRFNGDAELALTAYHSGAARVQKFLDQTSGKKLDDIIHLLGPAGKKYAKSILERV
jgi:soluble lytic murein transglycosylase